MVEAGFEFADLSLPAKAVVRAWYREDLELIFDADAEEALRRLEQASLDGMETPLKILDEFAQTVIRSFFARSEDRWIVAAARENGWRFTADGQRIGAGEATA